VAAPAARRRYVSAAAVAVITILFRLLTFNGFSNDHYLFVARARQILMGEWPVRDFVDPGMPLMYVLSALVERMVGGIVVPELILTTAMLAGGAAATVLAVEALTGSLPLAVAGALVEVIVYPRSYSYPKIVLYAVAALLLIAAATRPTPRRFAGLGLLTAVAFLFRHDHGIFIGLSSASLAVVLRGKAQVRACRLAAFVAAALLCLLPWAAFIQQNGGVFSYFQSGIDFSRAEAESGMQRPSFAMTPFDADRNAEAFLFYLFWALPAGAALAVVRGRRDEAWPGEIAAAASIVLLAAAVDLTFLRDVLKPRLPDAIVPAVLLACWLARRAWLMAVRRPAIGRRCVRLAIGVVAAFGAAAVCVEGDTSEQLDRAGVYGGIRGVRSHAQALRKELREPKAAGMPPSAIYASLTPYAGYFARCTAGSDRILVTEFAPEVYVLAERGFAGGHPSFLPRFYSSEREQSLTRLSAQSVPIVLVPVETEADFRLSFPLLNSYVEQNYTTAATIDAPDVAGIRLLVDRGRPVVATDPATGWPCYR